MTPAIAGNMVTGGHRLIIIIQSSLITIPHDMLGPGDRDLWWYLILETHSAITFGIQNRLSPRAPAPLASPDLSPINSQAFPKIFTSLTKRFGKIVNEDQDSLRLAIGWSVRNVACNVCTSVRC